MNQKDELIGDLYTAMTGAGHGHDEQPVGPPTTPVVGVGHEPDAFNVKPILIVPVFIGAVMFVTYIIVSIMFYYYGGFDASKNNQPQGTPSQTMAKISSTDDKANIKQPRLEGLYQNVSESRPELDTGFVRSVRPSDDGNSPKIRPEDLRPENYIDPITKQKLLLDYAWSNKEKTAARIPISVAMKLMLDKKAFPVSANPSVPVIGTAMKPKLSNGGNEVPVKASKDVPVKTEKKDDKHDEKK